MYVDHCHQFVSSLLLFDNLLLFLFSKDIGTFTYFLDLYVQVVHTRGDIKLYTHFCLRLDYAVCIIIIIMTITNKTIHAGGC